MTSHEQPPEADSCVVEAAHQRLFDAHELWHELADHYLEVRPFRRHLNSLIQELRNVSWLVQKEKSRFQDFDRWYLPWQDRAKQSTTMRWLTASRNRIVKQGDLNTFSSMMFRVQYSWLDDVVKEFPASASDSIEVALGVLLAHHPDSAEALITVRRTWKDYSLPSRELLGALADCWEQCAQLIALAHANSWPCTLEASSQFGCKWTGELHPPIVCFLERAMYYEKTINTATMQRLVPNFHSVSLDRSLMDAAKERYGDELKDMPEGGAIAKMDFFVERGKAIISSGEDLLMVVAYLKEERVLDIIGYVAVDRLSKFMIARQIKEHADEVSADGLIHSSETWLRAMRPGAEDEAPGEALSVVALQRNGQRKSVIAQYVRAADGSIIFDTEGQAGITYDGFLDSIRSLWSIDTWSDV